MVPKPYGVGYLAFYPLITYCFNTVVPLLAHGAAIFQIYCLLFPFRLSKMKTGVITCRFTVRTGSEPVLGFTWGSGPLLRMACTSPMRVHWFLCKMTQKN